jgi:hypothetical protein
VAAAEVQQLLEQAGCTEDPELAGFDNVIDRGYQLPDGGILLVYRNGKGALWASKTALFAARDQLIAQIQPPGAEGP